MKEGTVVASRFRIRDRVGQGGMGTIYRAEDLHSDNEVALKVLSTTDGSLVVRFLLEAKTLASLNHHAIVRYVAHGQLDNSQPFLAMRWLAGSDLSRVLQVNPLTVTQTLAIVRRVAEGLAYAHERKVIHRDLKPANIVLINNDPTQATLVDFGVARPQGLTRGLTRTGAIIGTVGYMSSEQVQGNKSIDGRADLFALGCVAYECLTGLPAFGGDNIAAVLVRVLQGEMPRISQVISSIDPALDALISSLLMTDREQRLQSANLLIAAIDRMQISDQASAPTLLGAQQARPTLEIERTPIAMILCWGPDSGDFGTESAPLEAATAIAERWDATVTELVDGAMLLVFSSGNSLNEKVERGARAALELRQRLGHWSLSLTLTQAESSGTLGSGALPRPLLSVTDATQVSLQTQSGALGVTIDASTEGLLTPKFVVEHRDGLRLLMAYTPDNDESRKVLGRESPCVGREKELRLIEGTLDEVEEESSARVVVLVAPPGVGKSKIRREFLQRISARATVTLAMAKTDVGTKLAPFTAILQWIRSVHGPFDGATPLARWTAFESAAGAVLAASGVVAPNSIEFLGELSGVSAVPQSPVVREAQTAPKEMWARLSAAFSAWLRGLCAKQTVALVLEDLHWADSASVALISGVLPDLAALPLFVLATAWPDAESQHPAFFQAKCVKTLKLDPLGKKSAELIVRQLVARDLDDALVNQVVELAGGNPFLLEEIVRHVSMHRELREMPTSAIALVQTRLQSLSVEARRFLRMASVFGESFAKDAVNAVLQVEPRTRDIDAMLHGLKEDELLAMEHNQWSFRHSLVRQAAYEMLTESDRVNAHQAVARWLSEHSPDAPAMVAEHYEQAHAINDAARWYLVAIEQSERIGNLQDIFIFAAKCDRPEVDADVRANALYVKFYAYGSSSVTIRAQSLRARLALGDFAKYSSGWFQLTALELSLRVQSDSVGYAEAKLVVHELFKANVVPRGTFASITNFCLLFFSCIAVGLTAEGNQIAKLIEQTPLNPETQPLVVCMRNHFLRTAYSINDDPRALTAARATVALAREACSFERLAEFVSGFVHSAVEFGAFAEAEQAAASLSVRREELSDWRVVWLLIADAKLACHGRAPYDFRAMIDHNWLREMDNVYWWVRAYADASVAYANPGDAAAVARALSELEGIVRDAKMLTHRQIALILMSDLTTMLRDHEQTLALTDRLLKENAASSTGLRTRWLLNRCLALKGLGRLSECQQELGRAQSRLSRLAQQLDPVDRANFLALPEVIATVQFAMG